MLNIEKYKEEIIEDFKANNMDGIGTCMGYIYEKHTHDAKYMFGIDMLNWLTSEYKEPILTNEEKE